MELKVAAVLPFHLPAQAITLLTGLQLIKGTLKSSPQFKEGKKNKKKKGAISDSDVKR